MYFFHLKFIQFSIKFAHFKVFKVLFNSVLLYNQANTIQTNFLFFLNLIKKKKKYKKNIDYCKIKFYY